VSRENYLRINIFVAFPFLKVEQRRSAVKEKEPSRQQGRGIHLGRYFFLPSVKIFFMVYLCL
jgi:hypothetical protein